MFLVDTSVWIDYFKGGEKSKLQNYFIEQGLVYINDIILTELIPGLIHHKKVELKDGLYALDILELDIYWDGIIELQIGNFKNGLNKMGISDLIIAQQCLDYNIELWSLD